MRIPLAWAVLAAAAAAAEDGEALFEREILPILQRSCLECHSHQAGRARGGLYLDSRSGWEAGGSSGPAIVPGDPGASLLIRAVRPGDAELQMPPEGKRLDPAQVAALERWVEAGAPDPRVLPSGEGGGAHWAFQPVVRPRPPEVRDSLWPRNAVDRFVLRRLEEQGMRPSPRADRDTLIRRACYTLLGLPPSPREIEAFREDRSPGAMERLVDRLLASPRYGERWGRHWLDVARYADTKGYVFEEERRFPYSYTYRDYVVDAFNRDLPYDRFVVEQLAADLLEDREDNRALAGLGFLTLGRRFLNNQHDIIDDRIDVASRGLMALTVSCARCHDHKYDPIPTADYYSLYGVFASSREPDERPLLAYDEDSPDYLGYRQELERKRQEWEDYRDAQQQGAVSLARSQTGEYLKVLHDARGLDRSRTENLVRERKLGPVVAFRWQEHLAAIGEDPDPALSPWIAASRADARSEPIGEALRRSLAGEGSPVNPLVRKAILEGGPATMEELARIYGGLFAQVEEEALELGGEPLPDPDREALRQVLYRPGAPPAIPLDQATQLLDVPVQQKIRRLKRELDALPATHPGAPARAMSLEDRPSPVEPVVFLRGKPGSRGEAVPRQFLSLVEGEDRRPFTQGSGRLELARAIADPGNPLTARVIANRVWRHHFGRGLVDTPSDFGTRAPPPSHPELLDWLAATLVEDGWSLKRLHRRILLSSAWQQASDPSPLRQERDPENRWIWRMDRRRLELEPLRDTLLQAAGTLDLAMGGRPVEIAAPPYAPRRSVYGYIERQNLPSMFRTFDLASPDSTSPGRFETTVPQQALFLLNSPFVIGLARSLEQEVLREGGDPVESLYLRTLQRRPGPSERRQASRFLIAADPWLYGTGSPQGFEPFPSFSEGIWKGEGPGRLGAQGGASRPSGEVIRRWRVPGTGAYRIAYRIGPAQAPDADLAARIRLGDGLLLERRIGPGEQAGELEERILEQGQALDFAVESGAGEEAGFSWTVRIRAASGEEWESSKDFGGPPGLSPLAQLGQALLLSNELAFAD